MAVRLARITELIVLVFINLLLIFQSANACGGVYSGRPSESGDIEFGVCSDYFLSKRSSRKDLNCTYRLKNEDPQGAILLYFDYFYLNDNGKLKKGDTLKISEDTAIYYSYKSPQPEVYDTTTLNLTLSLYRSTSDPHVGFKACYRFLSAAQRLAWEHADKYIGAETVSPYHGGEINQNFAVQQDVSVSPNNKVHYTWYIQCNSGFNILLNFLNIELGASTVEVWDAKESRVEIKMDKKWNKYGNSAEQNNRRSLLSDGRFMYIRWIGEARQGDNIQIAFAYVQKKASEEACGETYMACKFGRKDSVCVSDKLKCDGTNHCHDGEDEDEAVCTLPEKAVGHYTSSYSNIAAIIGGAVCIFFLLLLSCMACVAYIRGPHPGSDISRIEPCISVEPIGTMSSFNEADAIARSDHPPPYLEVIHSKSYQTGSMTMLTKIDEFEDMPAHPPPYDIVAAYDKPDEKLLEVQLNTETCQPETRIWEHRGKSKLANVMKKKKKTNNPFCQHCNRQYRHECRVSEDWVCM